MCLHSRVKTNGGARLALGANEFDSVLDLRGSLASPSSLRSCPRTFRFDIIFVDAANHLRPLQFQGAASCWLILLPGRRQPLVTLVNDIGFPQVKSSTEPLSVLMMTSVGRSYPTMLMISSQESLQIC